MTDTFTLDTGTFVSAGVTARHIGRILGVSPLTARLYLNGKSNPHRFIADAALKLQQAVIDSLDDGALPIKKTDDMWNEEVTVSTLFVLLNRLNPIEDTE